MNLNLRGRIIDWVFKFEECEKLLLGKNSLIIHKCRLSLLLVLWIEDVCR
ncbi:hypothetical protein SLEP1_g28658 [Rubroshorea leprosula]|uniref:Uncharacterized protein n=1 Tax=Rubroshorea leprosula TaxID=152421 RepID=A0AAV5K0H0_9ROSI|nr:hypothetical protein SLEP1_g28658 [Rubroshorea leprosula]